MPSLHHEPTLQSTPLFGTVGSRVVGILKGAGALNLRIPWSTDAGNVDVLGGAGGASLCGGATGVGVAEADPKVGGWKLCEYMCSGIVKGGRIIGNGACGVRIGPGTFVVASLNVVVR